MPPSNHKRPSTGTGRRVLYGVLAALVAVALVGGYVWWRDRAAGTGTTARTTADPTAGPVIDGPLVYTRKAHPARTVVTSSGHRVATFTDGARVADLVGPRRTFSDPKFTTATVTGTDWIRLLSKPWKSGTERESWFRPWLDKSLADRGPDVFGIAMQYTQGAPQRKNAKGIVYAGDAGFGPADETSEFGRDEKSDFYDYLGVDWTFPDGEKEQPEAARRHDLDCSGFLRMVYGYRMGYPMHDTNTKRAGSLPRRAYAINQYGPGTLVIANAGKPVADYSALQPGDLVFFNTERDPGYVTNHSGIYLGIDSNGHRRFISSRTKANGPNFGDVGGTSLLDDGAYYSERFRAARRL